MSKPSIKILKESAELFGCELSGGSIKAATKSLKDFFTENYSDEELSKCPKCENDAPDNGPDDKPLEACPFCGARFAPVPGEEVPEPKPAPKKRNKPNVPKKPKIAKKKKAPEPVEHIATPEQKEELKEHVARIEELRSDVARNTYDIGVELNQINDKALWRGLGYDSFYAYCKTDLDFSRASAYKYMMVAREFDREEFGLIGVKKGELIASAPERHKKKLKTAAVKKGRSFTELRSQLDKLEGKQRGVTRDKKSDDEKPATEKKPVNEKLSLLGKVKKGEDLELSWIDAATHEPIEHKDISGRYLVIGLTDEVELVIVPSEDELGVVVNFRKVGDVTIESEEEPEDEEGVESEDEDEEEAVEEEESEDGDIEGTEGDDEDEEDEGDDDDEEENNEE